MESTSDTVDAGAGDIESMRKELTEFGFKEDDLCREEMSDLLKALRFSKSSATEEENCRTKQDSKISKPSLPTTSSSVKRDNLIRKYRNVVDRRLPWCLLPPNLTNAQKAKCLATYIKLLSMNQYMRARGLSKFEPWPPAQHIASGGSGVMTRATRSGRSAPSYALLDDDDSMDEFLPKKTKKRTTSHTECVSNESGIYSNKTFSLKRKLTKTECPRSEKESKIEGSEASEVGADSSTKTEIEEVASDASTVNICRLIDSFCNNEDISISKESMQKSAKKRQKKT